MTRRSTKYSIINHENDAENVHSKSSLLLCNGYSSRSVTRQSSQELLKVQCNGLAAGHRSSKLLSPSGSDVLPLPTSTKRCTRRASASWCGSTRELSQLSPTDSEIENSLSPDCISDTTGSLGVRSNKGQLWLSEENETKKRYGGTFEPLIKCTENIKPTPNDLKHRSCGDFHLSRVFRCNDCPLDDNDDEQCPIKKDPDDDDDDDDDDDLYRGKIQNLDGSSRDRGASADDKSCLNGEHGNEKQYGHHKKTFRANHPGKRKKLSPEEKLLQDNKEYFKMEVLNTKLRSSGSLASGINRDRTESNYADKKIDKIIIKKIIMRGRKRDSRWTKSQYEENTTNDVATKLLGRNKRRSAVKLNGMIRKKRQSELMTLCDEAESFMFGSQQANISGPEIQNSNATAGRRTFSSQGDKEPRFVGIERVRSSRAGKTRKKRRSHAEAFIHDNIDYYKFETPDSRLRYPPQGRQTCCDSSVTEVPSSSSSSDSKNDFSRKRKRARIDSTCNEESGRLDTAQLLGLEKETATPPPPQTVCAGDPETRKVNSTRIPDEIDKLLFSFESVPITEPWYDVYKRQDEGMENYYPILSDPNDEPFLLPYELPKPIGFGTKLVPDDYYKRKKRQFGHVLSNHPRKSPRCHASTLAILSSLKKRKRRSGTNISLSQQQQPSPNDSAGNEPASSSLTMESSFPFPESDGDNEYEQENSRMILEPLSDSESKKNIPDGFLSAERQQRYSATGRSRGKNACKDLSGKHFTFRNVEADSFFKDMIIETGKRSDLNINIISVLENFKTCTTADSVDLSDFDKASSIAEESCARRKRKKCRKINKTGWDNSKKSRRHKLTINKILQVKQVTCESADGGSGIVEQQEESTKTNAKTNSKDSSPNASPLSVEARFSRRVLDIRNQKHCQSTDDRSKSRLQDEVMTRRKAMNQENEIHSRSESCDSRNSLEYSPCVVRVKKINQVPLNASVKLRCANGRYSIQSKRLVSNRKKKRVMDYAWTTRKRRR